MSLLSFDDSLVCVNVVTPCVEKSLSLSLCVCDGSMNRTLLSSLCAMTHIIFYLFWSTGVVTASSVYSLLSRKLPSAKQVSVEQNGELITVFGAHTNHTHIHTPTHTHTHTQIHPNKTAHPSSSMSWSHNMCQCRHHRRHLCLYCAWLCRMLALIQANVCRCFVCCVI